MSARARGTRQAWGRAGKVHTSTVVAGKMSVRQHDNAKQLHYGNPAVAVTAAVA